MPTVLSCQGKERREIKANKTSKSKIPKPPLWYPAAVKVNTGRWHRGKTHPEKKPGSCGVWDSQTKRGCVSKGAMGALAARLFC